MKLSISTFKIICNFWNYPEEIIEDKEYLRRTIDYLSTDRYDIIPQEERETAKEEIKQLIETL